MRLQLLAILLVAVIMWVSAQSPSKNEEFEEWNGKNSNKYRDPDEQALREKISLS